MAGTVTVRTRSLVWFALGIVTSLVATAVWMSAWSADAAPGDSDTTVVPITSCRLTDTRPASKVGPRGAPLGPKETYTVQVQDASTKCVGAVPTSATGLLLNVTAVQMTQPTFLSIWDQGPFPGTSSLNPVPGPPVPNAVTTKLADDDTFRIYNAAGTTHVIIDIVGYLTPISLQELAATAGTPGPKGDAGDQGDRGFSAWDTIPSGVSVTGNFSRLFYGEANRTYGFSVPLPGVAPTALTADTTNFAPDGRNETADDDAACTGSVDAPTAPPGKVCMYGYGTLNWARVEGLVLFHEADRAFWVTGSMDGTSGRAELYFTWAYTAP